MNASDTKRDPNTWVRPRTQQQRSAQANADLFGVPYVVFLSTTGPRCERYDETLTCHREGVVFYPKSKGKG